MIWTKTEAGRAEMQARSRLADRSQRMLLLLIDGVKSEEMLLTHVAGITPAHFQALRDSGLIEPLTRSSARQSTARAAAAAATAEPPTPIPEPVAEPRAEPAAAEDDAFEFAQTLGEIISRELGLRGESLALAVEQADTMDALGPLAQRTIWQIRQLKGDAAADKASRRLFG
jgi:hypothetical protein